MTARELREYFNNEYGISKPWPEEFEVDLETLVNVYIHVLRYISEKYEDEITGIINDFHNNQVMYKNVKLVLRK